MSKANAEQFSLAGDQFLGRSYSEMDCQQFVENCMQKVGITQNLAGSNAWFRRMTWVGTPEECKKKFGSIPKGALLYILKDDGGEIARGYHDGIGNASHIGIKTGRGKGAIHSSSSKGCVCESEFRDKSIKNGGWNRIGLWDQFDYGEKINGILGTAAGAPEKGEKKMSYTAKVKAPTGKTVNLREKANSGSKVLYQVPIGAIVYTEGTTGSWTRVNYEAPDYIYTGYMMTKFLEEVPDDTSDSGTGSTEYVTVQRSDLLQIYGILDQILNAGGGAAYDDGPAVG